MVMLIENGGHWHHKGINSYITMDGQGEHELDRQRCWMAFHVVVSPAIRMKYFLYQSNHHVAYAFETVELFL